MFLRKSSLEPLPVTMSAVRMGERVLQIGIDEPAIVTAIAAKVGLSGSAAIAVTENTDAERVTRAAAGAGLLIDVKVTPLAPLPYDSDSFDLVVVHATRGLVTSLDAAARVAAVREWNRVLRDGGRVMTIESIHTGGLKALLRRTPDNEGDPSGGILQTLQAAGFHMSRVLAEREGFRFAEAIKT